MASYNELNALIDAYINRNGVQAITGQILNGVLKAIVEQIGRGYAIMGVADLATDPGTPDAPESWFASTPGTYTNFGGLTIADAEFAIFSYTPQTETWEKTTLTEGIAQVDATIDGNVGTPAVSVSYENGVLSFDFSNMKGNPGDTGDAAGFGTITADVDGNIGTPGVTVAESGPATGKNLAFHFTNLKGETGVTSVVATVDNTTGTPSCTVSLVGQQLTLAFSGLKGAQGDTGVSADYPIAIVNNLTTDDAASALSAAQGKVLDGKVNQLQEKVNGINIAITQDDVTATASSRWYDNNGKVASDSSGVLKRVDMIPVVPGALLTLETTLSYATNPAGFICDDEDNILVTIARVGATTSYSGTIPNGATRLYVNYVTTLDISIKKAGKQDELTFDDIPIEDSSNPVKSGGIYPISADVETIKTYLYGAQFEKSVTANLVTGTGINQVYPENSMPLSANKVYKVEVSGVRTNGTVITFYLEDESGTNQLFRYSTDESDLDSKSEQTSVSISSTTSTLWVKPSVDINRIKLYSASSDVKDTTELVLSFSRQEEGIEPRIETIEDGLDEQGEEIEKMDAELSVLNEKIGTNDLSDIPFSAEYLIWAVSGNKVTASSSSFTNQRNISPVSVQPGGSVTITQTIQGTGDKAIFADNEDNVLAVVAYTEEVTNYNVPDGATRLYINRKSGTTFELLYKSATSAKFDELIDGGATHISLPIYAPSPQKAADGQDGALDAENSTSDQVFAKCDEAIAKYTNYATSEVLGKDATNTYDVKRYILCRANLYAWRANAPFYAWKAGANTRYIKSCSPRVGDSIYDSTLLSVVATVVSFDCNTGVMTDSANATYSREKTADIAADIIYTDRQSFTFSFKIYNKQGSNITTLATSAWDSDANTITYNGKTYYRSRIDDWNTECKATIILWGNEHAAQSDPHEPSIVLYRLIRDLCQSGPSGNKFLSFLKNYCKLVILPIVNVYGYTRYATVKNTGGRVNGNGVNINRNYPTSGWSAGSPGMGYGGSYGGSEIETQYVMNSAIEFDANIGIDIHCLGYTTQANEGGCAYGGNFGADKPDVVFVDSTMKADYTIRADNYGDSSASGEGEGKNWMLANGIEGGLVEMNAGAYALQYNGNQHTALIMEADYTYLLRMLNVWNNRFSNTMNLANYMEG